VTRGIFAIANQAHLHRKRMQKSFISTAQQIGVLRTFCASRSAQAKALGHRRAAFLLESNLKCYDL
jgi:hypothetical protein